MKMPVLTCGGPNNTTDAEYHAFKEHGRIQQIKIREHRNQQVENLKAEQK